MEESALHGLNQDTIKPRLRIVCPSEIVGGADISIDTSDEWEPSAGARFMQASASGVKQFNISRNGGVNVGRGYNAYSGDDVLEDGYTFAGMRDVDSGEYNYEGQIHGVYSYNSFGAGAGATADVGGDSVWISSAYPGREQAMIRKRVMWQTGLFADRKVFTAA